MILYMLNKLFLSFNNLIHLVYNILSFVLSERSARCAHPNAYVLLLLWPSREALPCAMLLLHMPMIWHKAATNSSSFLALFAAINFEGEARS